MAEDKKLAQAKVVFDTLCQSLEHYDWHFEKDIEDLSIECGARGDDLPMDISIKVDAERSLILLLSHFPFVIQEDKRLDTAIAVSAINNLLIDGSFDYDVVSGHMFFRMTNSFIDCTIGEDIFSYMLLCSCKTIDRYNDKFLMISKGMLSVEQFIDEIGK